MQSDWPSWFDFIRLLAVPALVLLNGFFVAAEFALVAVRRTRVETFVREKRRGSKLLQEQITSLDRSIAATQLGITLASLALGWIGEPALARLITPLFYWLGEGWALTAFVHTIATVVAFLLITIMHVVLGELAPKTLALQRPDQIALRVAWPLAWSFSADSITPAMDLAWRTRAAAMARVGLPLWASSTQRSNCGSP